VDTGCLDESTVLAFLDGRLPATRQSAAETHLGACSACAELTTWAAAERTSRHGSVARDGRPFVGQLAPGMHVERYQILSAVGRGGMGEVYAAYHPDLDRRIALKVVSESSANAPEQRARLLREARAIARLSHPNVVAVYDAGTIDDRVYIAMEFIDGETVDAWLHARPRGWREVLDVFVAAGRGLAAAHAAGIIHRDFKPQNVMIGRDGSVRVTDFGLARLAEEPADAAVVGYAEQPAYPPATVTKIGALVGTPAYMAPEQFRGESLDARADQFSFCVTLHEALHGTRPPVDYLESSSRADDDQPPRGRAVPSWLQAIVNRGLAEPRERRWVSMDELLQRLTRGRLMPRRRSISATAAIVIAIVGWVGWRVAQVGRIRCTFPVSRIEAVVGS